MSRERVSISWCLKSCSKCSSKLANNECIILLGKSQWPMENNKQNSDLLFFLKKKIICKVLIMCFDYLFLIQFIGTSKHF